MYRTVRCSAVQRNTVPSNASQGRTTLTPRGQSAFHRSSPPLPLPLPPSIHLLYVPPSRTGCRQISARKPACSMDGSFCPVKAAIPATASDTQWQPPAKQPTASSEQRAATAMATARTAPCPVCRPAGLHALLASQHRHSASPSAAANPTRANHPPQCRIAHRTHGRAMSRPDPCRLLGLCVGVRRLDWPC